MKILLTGGSGQIGGELQQALRGLDDVHAPARADLDLSHPDEIRRIMRSMRPDIVVNAAAYTSVDQAEADAQLAFAINRDAPAVLAEEAARNGSLLVHFSTDYVFDGTKDLPYQEDDVPAPLGVYGRSKAEGEAAVMAAACRHLILRTSWIYSMHGRNFLLTMMRLLQDREEVRVVSDQFGAPTWARSVAQAVREMLPRAHEGTAPLGLFHLAAAGSGSWYDFAREIAAHLELQQDRSVAKVSPITTAEWSAPARRPANSRLSCERLQQQYGIVMPAWDEALRSCFSAGMTAPATISALPRT